MDISSTSNSSFTRSVTPANSSNRDRAANNEAEASLAESKSLERIQQRRATQERVQQRNNEQRRLDGRLISYGPKNGETTNDYKQVSFNRARVNEAYSAPKNESIEAHKQQRIRDNEAIDIVV